MRTVLVPVLCLLLGLAAGYVYTSFTVKAEVTPAMIEQGLRENPGLVLDLLQQYPEDVFEVVLQGQQIKQKQAREEQILAQLMDPIEVEYDEDRPVRGNSNAPITIVEFSDFQCPHCANASEVVKQLIERHPDLVNQVFLHMPLSSHQMAPLAAAWFEAAAMQDADKAWKLHDIVFANQDKLEKSGDAFLRETAQSLGLNLEQLEKDLASEKVRERLKADLQAAQKIGLRGTPSYVIEGVVISGAMPRKDFEETIMLIKDNLPPEQQAQKAPSDSAGQTGSGQGAEDGSNKTPAPEDVPAGQEQPAQ